MAIRVLPCRFILLLADRKSGYFFYLYVVYFALQAWLALLALFHYPDIPAMTPVDPNADFAYQVSCLYSAIYHINKLDSYYEKQMNDK